MYLKRLDLQGFKSFASHTHFDFGPGITAVVGPNGSGKSNVAEAIRWVLGEQSSRQVRARRLEDVIFSGSSQKSAVGMAEVSITLDNAEGWLPVDFTEVVLSRRAFRSGESEYLLNKSKVRMRDVQDLLLRAQVGQNSYAFMGQGLVDEVLVMRPDDRRRLLEEAADVRLLRTRLDEARDRLAATRENLERVNLLIEEIGPRLAQLERQASRAIEHGRLARELSNTLQRLYSLQWSLAQEALTAAGALLTQRREELEAATRQANAHEEALAALSAQAGEREQALSAQRTRRRELSDRLHTLEQRLGFDRERLESHTRRRAEIEAEIQSLADERADLQHALARDQERARTVVPEIEEARSLINTRRQELNALEQEQSSMRRRIAESEDKLERAQRNIADAAQGLKRLAEEEARAQGDGPRRANRRREILQALSDIGREYLDLRDNLRDVERELDGAEQERIGLAAMVDSTRNDLRVLENDALQIESDLGQLRGREELLRRLLAAQEGVDSGARALLGDADDPSEARQVADGLIGLVRDIIRVPPGLERAIEAALTENLNALVFENLSTAVAALQFLEQGERGRALIYPLDGVRVTPPVNLIRERGLLGVASRSVRCDNRFRPLVDMLLGRTIIVEDVNVALQVIKRGLGSVVTLDGFLLRPNGGISGGFSRTSGDAFVRQRELDELPEHIAALAQRKATLDYRIERERESLENSSNALAKLAPHLTALREEWTRYQNALHQNRNRLVRTGAEAKSFWAELRRGSQDMDRRGRRERLQEEQRRAEAIVAEVEETLKRDRQALQSLSSRRNEAIDAISEAAAAHADLEGEARSLSRQAELTEANLRRAESRLKDREESLRALEAEAKAINERSESGAAELATLQQELETLIAEIEPAEAEMAQLTSRERELRDRLSALRGDLLAAERRFLEAESAVTLRSDELESLLQVLEAEGFQLDDGRVTVAGEEAPSRRAADLPEELEGLDVAGLRRRVTELRNKIRALGPVNEQAQADYGESKERYDFLTGQVEDLQGSEQTLLGAIEELENNIRERLTETYAIVDREFQRYFESFFNGGKGKLLLTNPDDMANTGVEVQAQPGGKRVNTLAMLSGGERALTALALLLALLQAHPSPICVLDEVDAALDETNVGRFVDALKDLAQKTQFIIITHNPRTVEAADSIYGVSMGSDSTSKILSVKLAEPA